MSKLNSNTKPTKRLCSVDGCGRPQSTHGLCDAHYSRLRKTGTINANEPIRQFGRSLEERFWSFVDKSNVDECWIWAGCVNKQGYGFLGDALAHRVSWKLHNGVIPKRFFVCHKCDNPRCVNPNHLFLGTHQSNMNDMVTKGRQAYGMKNCKAKLTSDQVLEIRKLYTSGDFTLINLGGMYKVNQSTIWKIIKRIHWDHL